MYYKIIINDRNYESYELYNANTLEPISYINMDPFRCRLFSTDVFEILNMDTDKDKDTNIEENVHVTVNNIKMIHSCTRISENIPAILILSGNKTYGRHHTNNKLLYKCIPDDTRIPPFLVPYEMKNIGFTKIFTNLYVTIQYTDWSDNDYEHKHPHGKLSQVIGPVDILDNFYEYQLYCKSLNTSIQKMNKATNNSVKNTPHDTFIMNMRDKYPEILDRTKHSNIFTIDPEGSLDYDDAFSIYDIDDTNKCISIYIANVSIWLDVLNLWDTFSKRISTIYLPDKKRPMLPTILSDCLCSLQENTNRVAFTMDIIVTNDGVINNVTWYNSIIKVSKNYVYEEESLLTNPDYKSLLFITQKMSKKYKYISNIRNSHDLVCYLMILMNCRCAQKLLTKNMGVFRSTIIHNNPFIPDDLPEEVGKFIKIWNSACGQYININLVEPSFENIKHEVMDLEAYIHITSPIRRLVDLLNMICFQKEFGLILLSENTQTFYDKWIGEMEYINTTMRAIKKIQNDCHLLHKCMTNTDIMEKEYDGYCFDKLVRNDGLYQYIVYLPELKLSNRITIRENLDNYDKRKYKLFLFYNEEQFKRKIRLQLIM